MIQGSPHILWQHAAESGASQLEDSNLPAKGKREWSALIDLNLLIVQKRCNRTVSSLESKWTNAKGKHIYSQPRTGVQFSLDNCLNRISNLLDSRSKKVGVAIVK